MNDKFINAILRGTLHLGWLWYAQKFIHSKVESVSWCRNKYQIPFCIPACVVSSDFFTIPCLYLVRLKYLRFGKSISETLITSNHKKTKLVEIWSIPRVCECTAHYACSLIINMQNEQSQSQWVIMQIRMQNWIYMYNL